MLLPYIKVRGGPQVPQLYRERKMSDHFDMTFACLDRRVLTFRSATRAESEGVDLYIFIQGILGLQHLQHPWEKTGVAAGDSRFTQGSKCVVSRGQQEDHP